MQAYVRNNPRTRFLPTSGLKELAKDIAHLCLTYTPAQVLVNLSDNDLTLTSVRELIGLLDKDEHIQERQSISQAGAIQLWKTTQPGLRQPDVYW